jgi:hypothetical protein
VNSATSRKAQIVDLLRLLSSEEEQLEYERNVPHVDITAELRGMWFDDQYHPKLPHFDIWFSVEELMALEEFDRFYDERIEMLPESQGTVTTWHKSLVWQEIMQKAKDTIEKLTV